MLNKETIIKTTGLYLRNVRTKRGYSQNEISSRMGKGRTWCNDLERGKMSITFDDLLKLCEIYVIDINDIYSYLKETQKKP